MFRDSWELCYCVSLDYEPGKASNVSKVCDVRVSGLHVAWWVLGVLLE